DRVQDAGDGQVGEVVAGGTGERAVLAPAGHPAVDEGRVGGVDLGGADAEAFGDAGAEALDQDLGPGRQAQHQIRGAGRLEVDGDRVPAAPEHVVPGVAAGLGRGQGAGVGTLQPEYVGAEVGEQHPGEGRRPDARQLDDPDTRQRSTHAGDLIDNWSAGRSCTTV